MPVMDEFREEREALKNGTPKQKLQYFWDYYRWHVVAVIVIGFVLGSLIYNYATKKDTAFYAAFINSVQNDYTAKFDEEFAEILQIDTKESEVLVDGTIYMDVDAYDQATVASMQKIMVYTAAGDLDVMVTDVPTLNHYAYLDAAYDLRTILSPEDIAKYEPYFYYADKKVVDEKQAATDAVDMSYEVVYPKDPFDPSGMADPVPVGICVNDSKKLMSAYSFRDGKIVFSILNTSKHADMSVEFLHFLYQPEPVATAE